MHICYIADASSVHVHRWVSFFAAREHRVSLVTDVPGHVPGADVYNIGDCLPGIRIPGVSAGYQIMTKVRHIRRILLKLKTDIVHGHYATNYGFLAALSGFQPLVQTVHGSDILVDAVGSWEERWFVKYALQQAARVTVVAEHMAAKVRALGVSGDRLMVHQYGVDTNRFLPPARPEFRRPYRIVSTRMFEWKYNVEQLVQAIPKLCALVPNVEIVLAGDGPKRGRLESLIDDLKVRPIITMPGRQAHDAIPDLLRSATVYVSTSITDGTSLSLLEAMACGVFPVVTDIPGNRSWVTDDENGFLFPAGDPEILADRIARALEETSLREDVVARNLELVRTRGDYQLSMASMESEYQGLLR